MTEEGWLAAVDPISPLVFLEGKVSNRKLHLFASACCRRIWPLLTDERSRSAVEVAERLADGLADKAEWDALFEEAKRERLFLDIAANAAYHAGYPMPLGARHTLANAAATQADDTKVTEEERLVGVLAERRAQTMLVREIVGNPFRPVAFDPVWRTTDVLLLARGIYEERAFDRMPILADALQDAGCENEDILNHLRDANATHVRGCWALDLVLDKS